MPIDYTKATEDRNALRKQWQEKYNKPDAANDRYAIAQQRAREVLYRKTVRHIMAINRAIFGPTITPQELQKLEHDKALLVQKLEYLKQYVAP